MSCKGEPVESIFDRLIELSFKSPKITLNLLKEHNLANTIALMALFEEIDTITVREAISVTPERSERRKIWRRRKSITLKCECFIPKMLLKDQKKYYMILKARDESISRKDAATQLGICDKTLCRYLKEKNIPLSSDRKDMGIADFKLIAEQLSKVNRVSLKEIMSSLGIKKSRVYSLAELVGVTFIKRSVTHDEFLKIKEKHNELVEKRWFSIFNKREVVAQHEPIHKSNQHGDQSTVLDEMSRKVPNGTKPDNRSTAHRTECQEKFQMEQNPTISPQRLVQMPGRFLTAQ